MSFPQPFRALLHRYQWVHLGIGISGNAMFFVGSVLFLWESLKTAGIVLFIVGSFLMLLGSIGSAIVKLWRSERERDAGLRYHDLDRTAWRASRSGLDREVGTAH